MNIENLEAILNDMRSARFDDAQHATRLVRQWAEDIDAAISDHLLAELGINFSDESIDLVPSLADGPLLEDDSVG
ncbi:hypothetical protein [Cognatiluteimonas profundi]|uniref:hypothetical protein n=1 Tax=Cognatiluteimonas profundi TaxID=2594501 RepID=UPI00131D8917|nr:hypothetical protein [Lysobacter profundi]